MATWKLTVKRGAGVKLKDIVQGAGAAEAQSETMSLNIDRTALTKGEALAMIEAIKHKVAASKWPAA